jgi:hypothetical protein
MQSIMIYIWSDVIAHSGAAVATSLELRYVLFEAAPKFYHVFDYYNILFV